MEKKKNKFEIVKKYLNAKIIFALIIILAIVVGGFFAKDKIFEDDKTTKLGFENIGELATQEAYSSNVHVTDSSRELFGLVKIPFTQSKYIYSYDTVIKAGFNFEEIKYDVDKNKKTISITLPKSKILSSELDLDSFKIYHEEESVFNNVKLKEQNDGIKKLKKQAETDAVKNGLLKRAEENGKVVIKAFFAQAYDLDVYKINFKIKK